MSSKRTTGNCTKNENMIKQGIALPLNPDLRGLCAHRQCGFCCHGHHPLWFSSKNSAQLHQFLKTISRWLSALLLCGSQKAQTITSVFFAAMLPLAVFVDSVRGPRSFRCPRGSVCSIASAFAAVHVDSQSHHDTYVMHDEYLRLFRFMLHQKSAEVTGARHILLQPDARQQRIQRLQKSSARHQQSAISGKIPWISNIKFKDLNDNAVTRASIRGC